MSTSAQPSDDTSMDRVTLRMPRHQLAALEELIDDDEYRHRSDAIRDAVRQLLEATPDD